MGLRSLMIRKSLRTKNKVVALQRARKILLRLDRIMVLERCMSEKEKQNIGLDEELLFIDEQ